MFLKKQYNKEFYLKRGFYNKNKKMNSKKNNQVIICPKCRINFSIINSFSNVSLSSQILVSLSCPNQSHVQCGVKNKNNSFYNTVQKCSIHKDKFYRYQCTTCDIFLCPECSKKHQNEMPTHVQIEVISKSNKKCHIHQEALLYNCDTCKELLCVKCISGGNHSEHKINNNIYENYFYYTKKENLEDFINTKKEQVKKIDDLIVNLFILKGTLQKEISDFSEILENSQFFQDIIDNYFVIDSKTAQENLKKSQNNQLGESFNNIFSQTRKENLSNYGTYELKNAFNFNAKIDLIKATKNNNIIAGINGKTISIFKVELQKYIGTIIVKENFTNFLEVLDGKNLAIAENDNEIEIFDLNKFTRTGILKGHKKDITSIHEILNEKGLITSSLDKTIKIWSLVNYTCIKEINEQYPIINMSFSKKQRKFFCLFGEKIFNNICVLDLEKTDLIPKLSFTCQNLDSKILICPPNIIVICTIKNQIVILDVKKEINYLDGHKDKIIDIVKLKKNNSNNQPNKYIASSSLDQTIKIWNPGLKLLLYNIELKCTPAKIISLKYGLVAGVFSDNSFKIYNNGNLIVSHPEKNHLNDILQLKNMSIMVISENLALIYH